MEQLTEWENRREYFTQAEAEALVGRQVRTRKDWPGVPQGSAGTVTQAGPSTYGWTVGIRWHGVATPTLPTLGVDWFTRHEYELWIEEM